ncbi:UNVERIFIED_CONTAM: hypothetical protein HDU68_004334 [Siphonaria sp. JEL0065]|nr:hypothetical protein HDU68_004334 [Siphonaria sp. JEL0065]
MCESSSSIFFGSDDRPKFSLEFKDCFDSIGSWTAERLESNRKYLVPVLGVGAHLSDQLARFYVDCTEYSDAYGQVLCDIGSEGYLLLENDFLVAKMIKFAPSFTEALEKLLQLEKNASVGKIGLWG